MKKIGFALILLFSLILNSCKDKTVNQVLHQLQSESYVQKLVVGNHKLEFRFVPETLYYLTRSNIDSTRSFSKKIIDSLKHNQGAGYGLMFTLTIAPKIDTLLPTDFRNDVIYGQITGEENYRKILDDFLFGLKTKIWVEANGKRFDLLTYNMSDSWGMSKSRSFTLLFDSIDAILPSSKDEIFLVVENLVPSQGRNRFSWKLPLSDYDFIKE